MPHKDLEKQREARRAYYLAHKEAINKRQAAYRKTHKEQQARLSKAWYEKNREHVRRQQKAYRESHKKEMSAYQKAYRQANREQIRARMKAYYQANGGRKRAYEKAHRERRHETHLLRNYGITSVEWDVLYEKQGGLCKICQIPIPKRKARTDHSHTTGLVRGTSL